MDTRDELEPMMLPGRMMLPMLTMWKQPS